MSHAFPGWPNPGGGGGLLDDGPPPLVERPVGGAVIPPPAGATFEGGGGGGGGGGLFGAFPGAGGGLRPPQATQPNPWTYGQYQNQSPFPFPGPMAHSQSMPTPLLNTPQTWAGAGSSPWMAAQPHRNEHGFGSTAWHPPDLPPEDRRHSWGREPTHWDRLDGVPNAPNDSVWANFGKSGSAGGNNANWFQMAAERDRHRGRPHSHHREQERGRSRHREAWHDDYDEIPDWGHRGRSSHSHGRREWGAEDDEDEWEHIHERDVHERFAGGARRPEEAERRHRKHETVAFPGIRRQGETDWDMLDQFGKMGLGDSPHPNGIHSAQMPHAVLPPLQPKHKRTKAKSKSRHRTLSLPSTPLHQPHPGIHITYEQHLQRHGLNGPREEELPYRPASWRPDYSVKGSFLGGLIRRGSMSAPEPYPFEDPVRRTLHPHLHFSRDPHAPPAISMDLRIVPNFPGMTVLPILGQMGQPQHFLSLRGRELNPVDLMQYATNPPVQRMRLYHKRIPWYIDIVASPGQGDNVKIWDVIAGLFDSLTGTGTGGVSQVRAEEYWAGEMGEHVSSTPSMPSVPLPGTPMMSGPPGKRNKRTAREQVSHSWRKRGQLAQLLTTARMISEGVPTQSQMIAVEGEGAEKFELGRGVRRVDWLSVGVQTNAPGPTGFLANITGGSSGIGGEEFRWIGLRRGKRGMWEIVTEV
ncbi:hypothetical protein VNI00_003801 [Paramarasmius palmivorus]|uniref:DUF6699 domain-containing protein n=1 Tax=Paramarasmius palmivorus TaxID=297713 RepID=A0AAW0DQD9_9AGAR